MKLGMIAERLDIILEPNEEVVFWMVIMEYGEVSRVDASQQRLS